MTSAAVGLANNGLDSSGIAAIETAFSTNIADPGFVTRLGTATPGVALDFTGLPTGGSAWQLNAYSLRMPPGSVATISDGAQNVVVTAHPTRVTIANSPTGLQGLTFASDTALTVTFTAGTLPNDGLAQIYAELEEVIL
jgi:hypothetical protein